MRREGQTPDADQELLRMQGLSQNCLNYLHGLELRRPRQHDEKPQQRAYDGGNRNERDRAGGVIDGLIAWLHGTPYGHRFGRSSIAHLVLNREMRVVLRSRNHRDPTSVVSSPWRSLHRNPGMKRAETRDFGMSLFFAPRTG